METGCLAYAALTTEQESVLEPLSGCWASSANIELWFARTEGFGAPRPLVNLAAALGLHFWVAVQSRPA